MDNEFRRLLYKNSPLTLLESYIAIERFILHTHLSFLDQYKLFDLLKKLLPNEENQLTCQGFLSWMVWRADQYEERSFHQEELSNKRLRIDERYPESNDGSLVHYTQRQLEQNINASSDLQQQIDRLQSIVLRLASNVDALNHHSDIEQPSPMPLQTDIKREFIEDNEPSEHDNEEDHEDEASDGNHRLDFPASTSTTNLVYPLHSIPTKTLMYNGRNMMKHLRPRTTLTSFARHVASDLFSREEIMAKLHVDHNNERDIFLRHCISTAWNLTEQELYSIWPKIRNALLQLRRDAIAGKCIRMNGKRKHHTTNNQPCNSEYEDDESQNKSDLCR